LSLLILHTNGDARGYGEPDCRPAPRTIIITDADGLTEPIHLRVPAVLDKADIGQWLSGTVGGAYKAWR
jgi:putative SOS response-associated peptidase YedK